MPMRRYQLQARIAWAEADRLFLRRDRLLDRAGEKLAPTEAEMAAASVRRRRATERAMTAVWDGYPAGSCAP
jgi:hypothetical protein